jgi:thiol:disulfide interchange protein DsbC
MRNSLNLKIVFILLLCAVIFQLSDRDSYGAKIKAVTAAEAEKALKTLDPSIKVLAIKRAPVEGLWEVVFESNGKKGIVYLDSARLNVVIGQVIDIASKTNLTKNKFDEINKIDVSLIPLDDALVMGNPRAAKKVIVFDDPD